MAMDVMEMMAIQEHQETVNATLEYMAFAWSYEEFKKVFPEARWEYMWEERGDNFIYFYRALDNENRPKLTRRIMDYWYETKY